MKKDCLIGDEEMTIMRMRGKHDDEGTMMKNREEKLMKIKP